MTDDEQRQMRNIADLADKALLEIHATRAILRELIAAGTGVAERLQRVDEKLQRLI